MKKNNDWESKAEEALNSLDGIQRATANPYLYTRVMARIENQRNSWSMIINFISRPAIALSTTVIFIAINAWVIMHHSRERSVAKVTRPIESELVFEAEYATVNYALAESK